MYWLSFGIFGSSDIAEDLFVEWTDGVDTFRLDVRSGYLFLDQTITATGWYGELGLDWAPITMDQ